ncbi:MAG: radical SAM protein [Spirochaetaceae bacterium]|nr:MAG: radical SAM protein [Spirochaetaceae bacterium]
MDKGKLNIALISPKGEFLCKNREFAEFVTTSREMRTILHFWNGIGVALPTIAALTPDIHAVTVIDENREEIDFDQPYDIVGITAMTQQANRAYEISAEFRRRGCHVAIGGIHASVKSDEVIKHADTVFIGEAEYTWPCFVDDFMKGFPGSVYDQERYPAVDITKSPLPRYDLLAKYKYPVVYIQTTRGCPHDCEFCVASNIYGKRYKHKNVSQVLEEVREVKKYWQLAQIGFADDNMFVNRKFSEALVEAFKDLNFSWFAVCDIEVATSEKFLANLHASGCRTLLIGLESVLESNVQSLNKDQWKAKRFRRYGEYIERIQRNGIGVYGSFIIGFDADNDQTIGKTIDFINHHNLLGTQITILTPFPGSRLRERLEKENRILHNDWKWYTVWNAVIRHPFFAPEQLETNLLKIYRAVYNEDSNNRRSRYFRKICEKLVS